VICASPTPARAVNARATIAAATDRRVRRLDCLGTGISLLVARGFGLR
jgi:hypothetical protein